MFLRLIDPRVFDALRYHHSLLSTAPDHLVKLMPYKHRSQFSTTGKWPTVGKVIDLLTTAQQRNDYHDPIGLNRIEILDYVEAQRSDDAGPGWCLISVGTDSFTRGTTWGQMTETQQRYIAGLCEAWFITLPDYHDDADADTDEAPPRVRLRTIREDDDDVANQPVGA